MCLSHIEGMFLGKKTKLSINYKVYYHEFLNIFTKYLSFPVP